MEREILLHLDYDCFIPAEQYVPFPPPPFPPIAPPFDRKKRELTPLVSLPAGSSTERNTSGSRENSPPAPHKAQSPPTPKSSCSRRTKTPSLRSRWTRSTCRPPRQPSRSSRAICLGTLPTPARTPSKPVDKPQHLILVRQRQLFDTLLCPFSRLCLTLEDVLVQTPLSTPPPQTPPRG